MKETITTFFAGLNSLDHQEVIENSTLLLREIWENPTEVKLHGDRVLTRGWSMFFAIITGLLLISIILISGIAYGLAFVLKYLRKAVLMIGAVLIAVPGLPAAILARTISSQTGPTKFGLKISKVKAK